ncbi:MAG: hypothetical protein B1H04_05760 [Planctomycetales bacterium 4484_123]|nr:MAG: hypothetical protein B1H04_05760 [Planctomycetales bacterium 4484_123]
MSFWHSRSISARPKPRSARMTTWVDRGTMVRSNRSSPYSGLFWERKSSWCRYTARSSGKARPRSLAASTRQRMQRTSTQSRLTSSRL